MRVSNWGTAIIVACSAGRADSSVQQSPHQRAEFQRGEDTKDVLAPGPGGSDSAGSNDAESQMPRTLASSNARKIGRVTPEHAFRKPLTSGPGSPRQAARPRETDGKGAEGADLTDLAGNGGTDFSPAAPATTPA